MMFIHNKELLEKFSKKHTNSKKPLESWEKVVRKANWKTSHDIKLMFSNASFLQDNTVIFNIGGNKYRLVVIARYEEGKICIEWIGTHAEYDKMKF